ncbi:MAG: AbrB/MazE/SpoVT family DNA-binding domain-containing protein [Limnochordaceae bacterium]|nr:AbrB/MazE/SpoVT family DNA-binding domain-containing protein [Limnochordaceae bacterium]
MPATNAAQMPFSCRIDERGRVVLPVDIRKQLGLEPGDTVFVQKQGDQLILAKSPNSFDALGKHAQSERWEGRARAGAAFGTAAGPLPAAATGEAAAATDAAVGALVAATDPAAGELAGAAGSEAGAAVSVPGSAGAGAGADVGAGAAAGAVARGPAIAAAVAEGDLDGIPDQWAPYVVAWKQRAARAKSELQRWHEQALVVARHLADVLGREFGVTKVYLFGSLVSGKVHSRSDIDLAVEGLPPALYYRACARLDHETDIPIDLVDLTRAAPTLVQRVTREGVVLYERQEPQERQERQGCQERQGRQGRQGRR